MNKIVYAAILFLVVPGLRARRKCNLLRNYPKKFRIRQTACPHPFVPGIPWIPPMSMC